MEEKIIELAESLVNAYRLKEELCDKEYWINKAQKEAGFIPAKGDWVSIDLSLYKIEVRVYHKKYDGAKYWKNGVWSDDPFDSNYPMPAELLAKMKAW